MTKPTKWHFRPAKTQISLGIRSVWSESSLSEWRKLGSLATQFVDGEDSDQTGRMPRLIWVSLRWVHSHFVDFVVRRLIIFCVMQCFGICYPASGPIFMSNSSHLSPLTLKVVGHHRWRCNNTFPSFPVFRCPQGISKPHSRPFLNIIFPSLLLSSSPSFCFNCPLQNCLRHARGSWDMAIPSEFPFLYHG